MLHRLTHARPTLHRRCWARSSTSSPRRVAAEAGCRAKRWSSRWSRTCKPSCRPTTRRTTSRWASSRWAAWASRSISASSRRSTGCRRCARRVHNHNPQSCHSPASCYMPSPGATAPLCLIMLECSTTCPQQVLQPLNPHHATCSPQVSSVVRAMLGSLKVKLAIVGTTVVSRLE